MKNPEALIGTNVKPFWKDASSPQVTQAKNSFIMKNHKTHKEINYELSQETQNRRIRGLKSRNIRLSIQKNIKWICLKLDIKEIKTIRLRERPYEETTDGYGEPPKREFRNGRHNPRKLKQMVKQQIRHNGRESTN